MADDLCARECARAVRREDSLVLQAGVILCKPIPRACLVLHAARYPERRCSTRQGESYLPMYTERTVWPVRCLPYLYGPCGEWNFMQWQRGL
jgi:hypothetical protein